MECSQLLILLQLSLLYEESNNNVESNPIQNQMIYQLHSSKSNWNITYVQVICPIVISLIEWEMSIDMKKCHTRHIAIVTYHHIYSSQL